MMPIHHWLEKSSRDFAQKEAVVCKERRFTFQELDAASTRLAHFLVSQGVQSGDRVGIFSTKSVEEIIALFAILKMGGIFVHINPHFKEQQLSHVISDAGIRVLCVNDVKAKMVAEAYPAGHPFDLIVGLSPHLSLGKQFANVHTLGEIFESSPATEVPCRTLASDPASIIYTSGSTGRPKGIVVTHQVFYDSTVASAQVLENNQDDRLISVTPFSFDGALSQLFTCVLVGGTLVLQESTFPKDVVETMRSEGITGFHAVPSFWRMLLQKHSPLARHAYPPLRYLSTIGEVFPREDLLKLKGILSQTKFYMMYGTTEAFRSTYLPPDDFERKPFSVGKPFPGVRISIVDKEGQVCPPGQVGEIVHEGAFVARGYWNDPARTSRVFKGNAVYTGDLGKMDDEGYLYFTGRKDAMIKSRGFRISPEEIEACLYQMPEVEEAAVLGIPDDELGCRIKAIIAPQPGRALTERDVVHHCKKHLPYYMVPSVVEFQAQLPKTGTYKINRSQLERSSEPGRTA